MELQFGLVQHELVEMVVVALQGIDTILAKTKLCDELGVRNEALHALVLRAVIRQANVSLMIMQLTNILELLANLLLILSFRALTQL